MRGNGGPSGCESYFFRCSSIFSYGNLALNGLSCIPTRLYSRCFIHFEKFTSCHSCVDSIFHIYRVLARC